MLLSVLSSERAIRMNSVIMRAFMPAELMARERTSRRASRSWNGARADSLGHRRQPMGVMQDGTKCANDGSTRRNRNVQRIRSFPGRELRQSRSA
jgi:hypothetical protein